MTTETLSFEAEARELLGLMIHSLYKTREIFLRELISNASDALDKLRFEALTNNELAALAEDGLAIRLETDTEAGTLSVYDNGVGMSREELIENLGTVARSGSRRFLEALHEREDAGGELPTLIGQFGVGFYSAFIVADQVVVETRRAGAEGGWRWSSKGDGEYTIEDAEVVEHGTRVTLHLRARDDEAEEQDFTSEWVLRDVVKRYSDFVEYPIELEVTRPVEGDTDATETVVETLNSRQPLWQRPKDDVTPEQHTEFYRHLTHDWGEPLETIHFKAEGTLEYTALLYVPSKPPFDLFEESGHKSRLSLYVRRVLIQPECEDLLPPWLRFVRGVVDSPDLPLNVARDVLQENMQVRAIKKRLVRKLLASFEKMLSGARERYLTLWDAFGVVLKEGIWYGDDEDGRISKICLFDTTHGEERSTLAEVVARSPKDQAAIYYLTGADRAALEGSPHLESFRAKGFEVLLLSDPVDEWVVQRLTEFEGKPLKAIDRGDLDTVAEAEKERVEAEEREHRDLLQALETALEGRVKSVRFSGRLTDSAAVLVTPEGGMSAHMERLMKRANQEVPASERVLELNPGHALVARLEELRGGAGGDERVADYAELIYGQALIAEGSPLEDPARFSQLVTRLMVDA